MLIDFFLHLKARRLPVSIKEFLALLEALQQHVIEHSIDDFYVLSRAILVKDETGFDKFDRAFGEYFKGVEALPGMEVLIPEEWLRPGGEETPDRRRARQARKARLGQADGDLQTASRRAEGAPFGRQQVDRQRRHLALRTRRDTSRGNPGRRPEREPIGGQGLGKTRISQPRRQRRTRHAQHQGRTASPAPFCPQGAADELDLDGTIAGTARNAGWLDLHLRPERHNAVKVLLLLDIGGSMDDHIRVCEELFSACRSEFKHLEHYYFHNCVYDWLWQDNRRRHSERVATQDVLHRYGKDYKLIFVGDAAMSPYELVQPNGSIEFNNAEPGAAWLRRLADSWPQAIWLNPEAEHSWPYRQSTSLIYKLLGGRMFPLTLDGLERGMRLLSK
jgi:uncharacterized protein with von Willebrand factor type A (vWA) domain